MRVLIVAFKGNRAFFFLRRPSQQRRKTEQEGQCKGSPKGAGEKSEQNSSGGVSLCRRLFASY